MLKEQKNKKCQGTVGVSYAIAFFGERGWATFIPIGDNSRFDLVVEIEGKLNRVEVKTTSVHSRHGDGWDVQLKTNGGNMSGSGRITNFDNTLVDYLFVLTEEGDRFFIPAECVKGKSAIVVGHNSYKEFKM
jgi:hypothetical protein